MPDVNKEDANNGHISNHAEPINAHIPGIPIIECFSHMHLTEWNYNYCNASAPNVANLQNKAGKISHYEIKSMSKEINVWHSVNYLYGHAKPRTLS